MQSHRILSGLTILLMGVLIVAGWFLVAQPQLAAADTANSQYNDVQSQIAVAQAQIVSLKSDQAKLPTLTKELSTLRQSIPSTVDPSGYVNGLNALAAASGVVISAISVSDPLAYTPPVSKAPPAAPAGSTATATAAPVDPSQRSFTPPTDPRITSSNFVAIPVTITTLGYWDPSLAFVKGLQSGKRLFLVTAISTGHKGDDPNTIETQISGFIYAIVDPNAPPPTAGKYIGGDLAVITPATPAATTAPTATPTPGATGAPTHGATPTPTTTP